MSAQLSYRRHYLQTYKKMRKESTAYFLQQISLGMADAYVEHPLRSFFAKQLTINY